MAIKGKKISDATKAKAKKHKVRITEVKGSEKHYKKESQVIKEIEEAIKARESKQIEATNGKSVETKESISSELLEAVNSDALRISRTARQLEDKIKSTFGEERVKTDALNKKQVRFIIDDKIFLPKEGYYTTK